MPTSSTPKRVLKMSWTRLNRRSRSLKTSWTRLNRRSRSLKTSFRKPTGPWVMSLFFFIVLPLLLFWSPCVGSLSRGGDVTVYVWHKPTELAHSFLFCSCVYVWVMALLTVFHSITSLDNSPFSDSVLPVLSLPYWSFQLYISLWKSPSALI